MPVQSQRALRSNPVLLKPFSVGSAYPEHICLIIIIIIIKIIIIIIIILSFDIGGY